MHKSLCTSVLLIIAFTTFAFNTASAFPSQESAAKLDTSQQGLRQLVQQAVNNDIKAERRTGNRGMYRLRKESLKGTQVKEIVETKTISVARLLEQNGKPLSADQQRAEDDRLRALANDPDAQRKKLKEEKQDDENATKIFRALPEAFVYKYEGTQSGESGEYVHMTFSPDPKWDPPSRELQVLTGMEGTMDINRQEPHVVKIQAKLFRDVDFGWGVLGRLYKGGSFLVEQRKLQNDRWETTHMVLDITGKALLFKSLVYKESEYLSDFQSVPPDLSVQQGIDLLHKVSLAQNRPDHEPAKCDPCEPK